MKRLFLYLTGFTLFAITISGCGSIKSIHGYTSASVEGLSDFNHLGFNFQQSCLDRCELNARRNFSIQRDSACSCALFQQADSVSQLIFNAVASYLTVLNTLSSSDLTTYNYNALETAVSYGDFASLNISNEQANAYAALTRLILHSTDLYKKKKLKKFVSEANAPVQKLIKKLQFILNTNLESELNFRKESIYAYYKEMSLRPSLSVYEKDQIVQDYYHQLSAIQSRRKKIQTLSDILSQIATGHQKIYDHLKKWSSGKFQSQINQYAMNIKGLEQSFNQVK